LTATARTLDSEKGPGLKDTKPRHNRRRPPGSEFEPKQKTPKGGTSVMIQPVGFERKCDRKYLGQESVLLPMDPPGRGTPPWTPPGQGRARHPQPMPGPHNDPQERLKKNKLRRTKRVRD